MKIVLKRNSTDDVLLQEHQRIYKPITCIFTDFNKTNLTIHGVLPITVDEYYYYFVPSLCHDTKEINKTGEAWHFFFNSCYVFPSECKFENLDGHEDHILWRSLRSFKPNRKFAVLVVCTTNSYSNLTCLRDILFVTHYPDKMHCESSFQASSIDVRHCDFEVSSQNRELLKNNYFLIAMSTDCPQSKFVQINVLRGDWKRSSLHKTKFSRRQIEIVQMSVFRRWCETDQLRGTDPSRYGTENTQIKSNSKEGSEYVRASERKCTKIQLLNGSNFVWSCLVSFRVPKRTDFYNIARKAQKHGGSIKRRIGKPTRQGDFIHGWLHCSW